MTIIKKIPKYLLIGIVSFLLYFPLLVIILLSFNASRSGISFTGFTLKWYQNIISDETLFQAIKNTLTISILSTLISTILGTIFAIGIHSLKNKSRKFITFLNNVPIINADIVTAVCLMIIFSALGFKFGMTTMLLSHIFFSIPFVIINVLPRLKGLDKDLYYAAIDLGSTRFQALYKVIIPAIKDGVFAGALIAFTMSIDDFIISWFNTGNGFSNFSIWVYARLGRKSFSPSAYAYNTLITIITIVGIIIYHYISNKKQRELNKQINTSK